MWELWMCVPGPGIYSETGPSSCPGTAIVGSDMEFGERCEIEIVDTVPLRPARISRRLLAESANSNFSPHAKGQRHKLMIS